MAIDWNVKNEHRPSYMAHNVIYDMADDYFKSEDGFYSILSKTGAREAHDVWMGETVLYFPKRMKSRRDTIDGLCEYWFKQNCDLLIQSFFRVNGYKDIKDAIDKTDHIHDLFRSWDEFFERKRENFMAKQNKEIMLSKGVPAKIPASHGGVANLLKILTRTMQQQGADIRNIAKVQYAVCKQAGIYIPSEFITDVAVALDFNNAIEEIEVGK